MTYRSQSIGVCGLNSNFPMHAATAYELASAIAPERPEDDVFVQTPASRLLGYSTGAFPWLRNDPACALQMLRAHTSVVEIALCSKHQDRLGRFARACYSSPDLLDGWDYLSAHAPLDPDWLALAAHMGSRIDRWVAHPDRLPDDHAALRRLGPRLAIEHLDPVVDGRSRFGQEVDELAEVFALLPEATLIIDTAHIHRSRPDMLEDLLMCFGTRLAHIHISASGPCRQHRRPDASDMDWLEKILARLPRVPWIFEEQPRPGSAEQIRRLR